MHKRWILCGLGRLGNSLNQALQDSGDSWDLICPSSTYSSAISSTQYTLNNPSEFIEWNRLVDSLCDGDVLVLAVNDSNILRLVSEADKKGVTIIHCSGATYLPKLKNAYAGVFYPLQTFVSGNRITWNEIPVFVEFQNKEVNDTLVLLCNKLGIKESNIKICNSEQRLNIHLAAVFANNFTQTCVAISSKLLTESGFDLEVMLPILQQMAKNWGGVDPVNAITGPAARNDVQTIKKHLLFLEKHPQYHDLYALFTEIIKQMKS
jgi:predicted short-subunit dehydrogenase-like oxidoreductase (DUF2520 family)